MGRWEQKLEQLSNLIKFIISINDFRDLVDERDLPNIQIFENDISDLITVKLLGKPI